MNAWRMRSLMLNTDHENHEGRHTLSRRQSTCYLDEVALLMEGKDPNQDEE